MYGYIAHEAWEDVALAIQDKMNHKSGSIKVPCKHTYALLLFPECGCS